MTGNLHSGPGFNSQDDFGASNSPLLLHFPVCNPKGLDSPSTLLGWIILVIQDSA